MFKNYSNKSLKNYTKKFIKKNINKFHEFLNQRKKVIKRKLNLGSSLSTILTLVLVIVPINIVTAENLESYIQSALKNNPQLSEISHSKKSFEYSYKKETILPKNPLFSVGYQNVPLSTFPSLNSHSMSNVSVSVSQWIALPTEAIFRKKAALWKYTSESQRLTAVRKDILFLVKTLYHEAQFLYNKRSILIKMEKALHDIVSVARAMVSVNKMNSSHLLKLEADVSVIQNKLLAIEASINIVEEKLLETTLLGPEAARSDAEVWIVSTDKIILPKEFNYKKHPLYLSMQSVVSMEKARSSHEKSKVMPGFSVAAGYAFREGVPGIDAGEDFISLKVSVPLPLYYPFKEANSIKAQNERVEAARQKLRKIELALTSAWQGEIKKSQNLKKAFFGYSKQVVPLYLASYRAQMGGLSSGTVTLLDVLDTYRSYLAVLIDQAELYRNLQLSIAKLEYLVMLPTKSDKSALSPSKPVENKRSSK